MAAGASLRQLAARVERMADTWPREASQIVQRDAERQLRAATGDGSLSGGRDLGRATVTVKASAGRASVAQSGSARVWAIVEGGTKPHTVKARRGKLLRTPYGPRPSVTVAGTPAKRPWSRAVTSAMPQVEASARRAFTDVVG